MGEELDTDLSKEGWRRAAPNEVVWVTGFGNTELTSSDLRRSTLRNHWQLAATKLATGSHWNTTTDEDAGWGERRAPDFGWGECRAPDVGWGESKSPGPTDEASSAAVWGSAPPDLGGNLEDSRSPTVETHEELVAQGWAKAHDYRHRQAHDHRPTKRRRVDPWPRADKNSLGAQ